MVIENTSEWFSSVVDVRERPEERSEGAGGMARLGMVGVRWLWDEEVEAPVAPAFAVLAGLLLNDESGLKEPRLDLIGVDAVFFGVS